MLVISVPTAPGTASRGQPVGDQHVQQFVAVVEAPACVDDEQPVGVAVERDAEIGALVANPLAKAVGLGRADTGIDIEAVGGAADGDDLGAEFVEDARRDLVGGAVGGIDDDLQSFQRQVARNRLLQNSI